MTEIQQRKSARGEATQVGIFEKVLQERHPAAAAITLTPRVLREHGTETIVALAAQTLPPELRAPAFAIAVDLVMADGEANIEERKFIDGLQELLQIPEEDAIRIVDVILIKNSV